MTDLIRSFCFLLDSLLPHQLGLLYSQSSPRLRQALHRGFSSEHFLRRSRHVKHPSHVSGGRDEGASRSFIPDLDLLCIFDDLGEEAFPEAAVCSGGGAIGDMLCVVYTDSSQTIPQTG